ncbi:MAG: ribosomal protein S18-alanine N-acetyltransferase [Anaerolineaceae bacterium]|nr:ribosomal protein S18-alanine N-acetyltransferase [Anaerolineaceae bacterium]
MSEARVVPRIRIRRMQLADIDMVVAIDRVSFSLPWNERTYRYELKDNPNAVAWVAEQSLVNGTARIVGMVVAWLVVDEAHIGTLAVHPDLRGMGIGARLLATCLLDMAERGADQSLLEVRSGNLNAQKLYQRFGFFQAGVRKRYYHDNGEDALLLTLKPLDPQEIQKQLNQEEQ